MRNIIQALMSIYPFLLIDNAFIVEEDDTICGAVLVHETPLYAS